MLFSIVFVCLQFVSFHNTVNAAQKSDTVSSQNFPIFANKLDATNSTNGSITRPKKSSKTKSNVLILSCHGGYGHQAAAISLQQILQEHYSITIAYPVDDLKVLGIPSADEIYNKILVQGWYRVANFFGRYIVPYVIRLCYSQIQKNVAALIEKEDADIVISIAPLINFPATEAARKRDIPYLLITTDNDITNWIQDFDKVHHQFFEITTGTELSLTKDLLLSKNISPCKIHPIGLPIRADFFEKKKCNKIRQEHGLHNKPTVLIIMGGNGSELAYQYAKDLAEENLGIQLIVIAGKNADLLNSLNEIVPHPSNAIYSVGFTEKVSDFMAVSDILISKPGPGTIAEAIQMRLPILADNTSSCLYWEEINQKIISCYGIGEIVEDRSEICNQVFEYLYDKEVKHKIKHALDNMPPNTFHRGIEKIVADLVKKNFLYKFHQKASFTKKGKFSKSSQEKWENNVLIFGSLSKSS